MQTPPHFADRAAYFAWAEAQPRGRFERLGGEVVQMSPERWEHSRLKTAILFALEASLAERPDCCVIADGMTVAVDDGTDFEPDVSVHQGPPIPRDSVVIPNPVLVVEVLSPSTKRIDTTVKVSGYLCVARHYLIFRADRREVLHWTRGAEAPARPAGAVKLDPPGVVLDLAAIYDRTGVA